MTRIYYSVKFVRKSYVLQNSIFNVLSKRKDIKYILKKRRYMMLVDRSRSRKLIVQFLLNICVKKNAEDINFSILSYVDCHKYETNSKKHFSRFFFTRVSHSKYDVLECIVVRSDYELK